ncbi:ATP-binding protein [Falsiroseomonas sp. HW251]|uniref:ATP-binding protein n=1 Tax=Falsiroseomonas sp. HW251 TaxID=3390998 RepID=UPI003D32020F
MAGAPPPTPFVGRAAELAQLRAALACEAGTPAALLIRGEPGIGKSRLIEEALASPALELHASPFATRSPFHTIRLALAREAGLRPEDDAAARRAKIETLLAATAGATKGNFALAAALLEGDSGEEAGAPPPGERAQLMHLLGEILGTLGARRGAIVVEDVQWLDPSSAELMQGLMPQLAARGVTLLATALPGPVPAWLAPPAGAVLPLGRLHAAALEALVAAVVGGATLPPEALAALAAGSQGLPLLAEELVRGYLDAGGTGPVFPTLDEALRARLAPLPRGGALAGIAAAIGRSFPRALLAGLSGLPEAEAEAGVEELVGTGILAPTTGPFGDALRFRHTLVRDAIYRLLPAEEAAALHASIADTLEARFPAIARAQPQMMAMQRQAAGEPDKAALEWTRAGRDAFRRSAYAEAVGFFRQGLEATEATEPGAARDERELDLRLSLIGALICAEGYLADDAGAETERAVALAERLGGPARLMPAMQARWVQLGAANKVRASRDFARHVLAATTLEEVEHRLVAHRMCGTSSLFYGDLHDALRHYRAFMALFDPARHAEAMRGSHSDHTAFVLLGLSEVHTLRGETEDAATWREKARDWTRQSGRVHDECHVLAFAILHACLLRRDTEARRQTRLLETLTAAHALPNWIGYRDLFDGVLLCREGDSASGLPIARRGVEALVAARAFGSWWYLLHAEACLGAGALDEAAETLARVRPIMELGDVRFGGEYHRLAARLVLARGGDATEAGRELMAGLALADRQGATLLCQALSEEIAALPPGAVPPAPSDLMRGPARATAAPRRWTGGRVV